MVHFNKAICDKRYISPQVSILTASASSPGIFFDPYCLFQPSVRPHVDGTDELLLSIRSPTPDSSYWFQTEGCNEASAKLPKITPSLAAIILAPRQGRLMGAKVKSCQSPGALTAGRKEY